MSNAEQIWLFNQLEPDQVCKGTRRQQPDKPSWMTFRDDFIAKHGEDKWYEMCERQAEDDLRRQREYGQEEI